MATATTDATVVKKPKTFWRRFRALCMVVVVGGRMLLYSIRALDDCQYDVERDLVVQLQSAV